MATTDKPIRTQCPNPEVEAANGKTKLKRTMQMGVTVRKGEKPEIHEFIREDK